MTIEKLNGEREGLLAQAVATQRKDQISDGMTLAERWYDEEVDRIFAWHQSELKKLEMAQNLEHVTVDELARQRGLGSGCIRSQDTIYDLATIEKN